MSSTDEENDDDHLRGLARSIDDLFDGEKEEERERKSVDDSSASRPDAAEDLASADPLMDMEVVDVDEDGGDDQASAFDAVDIGGEDERGDETDEPDEVVARAAGDLAPSYDITPSEPMDPSASGPAGDAFAEFDGPSDVVSSSGAGTGRALPDGRAETDESAEPADPGDALAAATERYLAGDGAERDRLSRRIRQLASDLRDLNRNEPIADAAERLVVAAHRHGGQEAPVALARLLVTPSVATVLTHRVGSARDEERRSQLVEVAATLSQEMASAVADALAATDDRSARRAFMRALVAMGEDAMATVERMVADSRWFVVRNAVIVLGQIGGEASVQHLTSTLAHDDPRVRRETVLALAKIGGDDASVLVRNKLDDPDTHVRAAAAMGVGELGGERDVRSLVARLDEESELEARVAILRALGQIGDPGAVPALEKRAVGGFFSRGPTEVRVAAYRALAAIGTPHARTVLEDALDDRDPAVRQVAEEGF